MGEFSSAGFLGGSAQSSGKQYTSGGGRSLSSRAARGESIVRPFELESVLAADQAPQVTPDPEEETEVRWGKASQFTYSISDPDDQLNSGGISIRDDNDETRDEEEQQPSPALIYKEVRRIAFPIRIENPDDSSQYVIVNRIYVIVFDGPDGRQRTFIMDHPD